VADPENTAMLGNQAPFAHAPLDPRVTDSGPQQLRSSHHTVRLARDPRDFLLNRPAFGSHTDR
jgi:hypothetical protein